MKHILFVDDEPNVLEGLRSLLRKQRHVWEMTFVTSGAAALVEMQATAYDVIVSDMRMPEMDGLALLKQVQQDYPHVVRIVLSGQTDLEESRRMVHIAHQFLSKPCDGRDLQRCIERACQFQALLADPALRQVVGQIGQLPIKPTVYRRLVEVLENPASSMADAAAVIERDIGTSAKILQVVNSGFFGLPQQVANIKGAVSYLGLETVKMLALSAEMRQSQAEVAPCVGFSLDAMMDHGILAGRIAKRLLKADPVRAQDAFSAAMLADVGVLVLMSRLPQVFQQIVAKARASRRRLLDVEMETLGVTHAEIGAYLLGIWGLPYGVVEAVAHHHTPSRSGSRSFDVTLAVHIAAALAEEERPIDPTVHLGSGAKIDYLWLENIQLIRSLPDWRELAHAEASRS